jgi:L-aminopeptidase/D-esterase-like protein
MTPQDSRIPRPGGTDSLVDVPGLCVGQVELGANEATPDGATGVTAVVAPDGALGAVDVRGGAPGTRETDALSPLASGERVHAVLIVGRSVFGLAAADGATTELERRGIGIVVEAEVGRLTVPIVAAAVVFDFSHGEPSVRPGPDDGRRAVTVALDGGRGRPRRGNAGAGTGASIGGIAGERAKGGVGHASLALPVEAGTLVVGALAVVNAAGTLTNPSTGRLWAEAGGFGRPGQAPDFSRIVAARGQTTIGVIGTNARLSKAQLAQVAGMAHDGIARAIRPAHTGVDGDAVFALGVPDGADTPAVEAHRWGSAAVSIVGSLAADALTRAILDAVGRGRGAV